MSKATELAAGMAELQKMVEERMSTFEAQLKSSAAKPPELATLAGEFNVFRQFMWKALALVRAQVESLAETVDGLEMRSRAKVLLIHGIAEGKNEDLHGMVNELVRSKMGLTDFGGGSIKVCHRLGGSPRTPTRARAVLVRFTELAGRAAVWKAKTSLKGSGVTVSEFLTRTRHEVFLAARKHFGIAHSWTQEGRIVVQLPDGTRRKVATPAALKALTDRHQATPAGGADSGGDVHKPSGQQGIRTSNRIRGNPK